MLLHGRGGLEGQVPTIFQPTLFQSMFWRTTDYNKATQHFSYYNYVTLYTVYVLVAMEYEYL